MASQAGNFNVQEFADGGVPLVGGRLYTYDFGTTTQKDAYTDAAGLVPQTYTSDGAGGSYIALNSRGELPAPLYLASGSYDLALKRSDGSTVWTRRAEGLGGDLAASAGASLVGFLQSGTGAVARDAQKKLRESVSPGDFAAVGDGAADDTAKVQAAITAHRALHLPEATGLSVTTLAIPANTVMRGEGRASPINISGIDGISVAGGFSCFTDIRVSGPASAQLFYASATATDIRFRGIDVSNDATASPSGHGVQVNQAGCDRWSLIGSKLDVYSFGYLFNTTAGGSKGHIISGNHITTQHSDAIEINTPTTAGEDIVASGNVLNVAAGSGTAAGIGVGLAHVNGAAVVGNIVQRAWLHAFHVEDGSSNIAVVGNVAKHCQSYGVFILKDGVGGNSALAKAVTVIGNHLEADSIVAGKAGVAVANDAAGAVYGSIISGNVVRNFESGIWAGGEASHLADGNTIDSCTYAIKVDSGNSVFTRVAGTNMVLGAATALLYINSGTGAMVRAGKFVCDTKPTNIILKATAGTTRPGCMVAGFSWPQTQVLSAGVQTWIDLMPAGALNRINGRLTVAMRDAASIVNNAFYSATVAWDGTTLTLSNAMFENNGSIAMVSAPALRVSGSSLQIGVFCASAPTVRADVEFDGVYMA